LKTTQQHLEFTAPREDNARLANLCGPLDENLRQIEQALDVTLQRRGHRITIRGRGAKLALTALENFYNNARDPLSVEALFTLASVQGVAGHPTLARKTLERAVRVQPSNPQTWLVLGRYDLATGRPAAAVTQLQAAIYLDPQSISAEALADGEREAIEIHNDYIQALEAEMLQRSTRETALKNARAARARAAVGARRAGRARSAR